ncbi:hypothetical protein JTB14_032753 [Gonioctena quinquepunctata]|nr:hypothetical protein JTB14_032753 [Gonioctena quinquepunctata]
MRGRTGETASVRNAQRALHENRGPGGETMHQIESTKSVPTATSSTSAPPKAAATASTHSTPTQVKPKATPEYTCDCTIDNICEECYFDIEREQYKECKCGVCYCHECEYKSGPKTLPATTSTTAPIAAAQLAEKVSSDDYINNCPDRCCRAHRKSVLHLTGTDIYPDPAPNSIVCLAEKPKATAATTQMTVPTASAATDTSSTPSIKVTKSVPKAKQCMCLSCMCYDCSLKRGDKTVQKVSTSAVAPVAAAVPDTTKPEVVGVQSKETKSGPAPQPQVIGEPFTDPPPFEAPVRIPCNCGSCTCGVCSDRMDQMKSETPKASSSPDGDKPKPTHCECPTCTCPEVSQPGKVPAKISSILGKSSSISKKHSVLVSDKPSAQITSISAKQSAQVTSISTKPSLKVSQASGEQAVQVSLTHPVSSAPQQRSIPNTTAQTVSHSTGAKPTANTNEPTPAQGTTSKPASQVGSCASGDQPEEQSAPRAAAQATTSKSSKSSKLASQTSSRASKNMPEEKEIHPPIDLTKMDDAALEEKIESDRKENCECREQINEILKALTRIKCACTEAETKAVKKPLVKQASVFGQTMSGLKLALHNLQEKCKAKDRMIDAMTGELKQRTSSKTFERVLNRQVGQVPDYDKADDVASQSDPVSTNVLYTVEEERQLCPPLNFDARMLQAMDNEKRPKKRRPSKSCRCRQQNVDLSGFEIVDIRRITQDSIIIKWKPPKGSVTGYDIYVNGVNKSKVMSGGRTSAMIHSLDLSTTIQVVIYAVTRGGRCEPPAIAIYEIRS